MRGSGPPVIQAMRSRYLCQSQMLGEISVVAIRTNGAIRVLAGRCSHMSGPLSDGELADGCLVCPWHGSVFRVADGSVARGPRPRRGPRSRSAR